MKAIQSDEDDDHLLATSPDAGPDKSGPIVTPLPTSTSESGQSNGDDDGEEDGKQEEATVSLLRKSDCKEADSGKKLHEILYSASPILFVSPNTNRKLRVYCHQH